MFKVNKKECEFLQNPSATKKLFFAPEILSHVDPILVIVNMEIVLHNYCILLHIMNIKTISELNSRTDPDTVLFSFYKTTFSKSNVVHHLKLGTLTINL